VVACQCNMMHKYGVYMPKTVGEALHLDHESGTTYWREAIDKEMKNVLPL
jgi:hypothetical protein